MEFQRQTDNTTTTEQCSYVNSSIEALLYIIVSYLSSRSVYIKDWYTCNTLLQASTHSRTITLCGFVTIAHRFLTSEPKHCKRLGEPGNFSHVSDVKN